MEQQLKSELDTQSNVILNREVVNLFLEGIDEILDGLELMMNPERLKILNERINDVKEGKNIKSLSDFKDFIKKEGVDLDKIKDEL